MGLEVAGEVLLDASGLVSGFVTVGLEEGLVPDLSDGVCLDFTWVAGDAEAALDLTCLLLLKGFFAMLHSLLLTRSRGVGITEPAIGWSTASAFWPFSATTVSIQPS